MRSSVTKDIRLFRSRYFPQYFGTDPNIRKEPDMVGLLLGSRELLCLSCRISRSFVNCSSLSESYLPGESANYRILGESVVSVVEYHHFFFPHKTGCFSGRLITSRRRRVIQGIDTSSRPFTGTRSRYITSLPPDRGVTHLVVATYQDTNALSVAICRQVLPSPIQLDVPIPSKKISFLFHSPYSSRLTL
jgi:hypothetical protein